MRSFKLALLLALLPLTVYASLLGKGLYGYQWTSKTEILKDGEVKSTTDHQPPAIQIRGAGLVEPGDQATAIASPREGRLLEMKLSTTYDGESVEADIEYKKLAAGVSYPAVTTTTIPDKQLVIKVTTSDYQKN